MQTEVLFYETHDGRCFVREFIDSLDVKMQAKLIREIQFLQDNGRDLREPHSKLIGDGIFELRAQFGNDISRVLYFFYVGNKAVITNGFIKKTQKTPRSEIEKAKQYRADYMKGA